MSTETKICRRTRGDDQVWCEAVSAILSSPRNSKPDNLEDVFTAADLVVTEYRRRFA